MHDDAFDVIPYEVLLDSIHGDHQIQLNHEQDIKGDWKKLGSGSFGNVYKGMLQIHTSTTSTLTCIRNLPWY